MAVRGKQSLKQGEATMTEVTTEDNELLYIVSEHFHESNSDLEGGDTECLLFWSHPFSQPNLKRLVCGTLQLK